MEGKDTKAIAYNQGYDAFKSEDVNPYEENSTEWSFWNIGYGTARMHAVEDKLDEDETVTDYSRDDAIKFIKIVEVLNKIADAPLRLKTRWVMIFSNELSTDIHELPIEWSQGSYDPWGDDEESPDYKKALVDHMKCLNKRANELRQVAFANGPDPELDEITRSMEMAGQ